MELRKAQNNALEANRKTAFLLGLVVALALLFCALEYNSGGLRSERSERSDQLVAEDLALLPTPETNNELEEIPAQPPQPVIEAVRPASVAEDMQQEQPSSSNEVLLNDAEGLVEDSEVSEALPPPAADDASALRFETVERVPEFPGGLSKLAQWLTRNLRYPTPARAEKRQGRVVVSFIVNTDGALSDIKIQQSAGTYFDNEALRVMRLMPRWKPGEQQGQPCRTLVAIPIEFRL